MSHFQFAYAGNMVSTNYIFYMVDQKANLKEKKSS